MSQNAQKKSIHCTRACLYIGKNKQAPPSSVIVVVQVKMDKSRYIDLHARVYCIAIYNFIKLIIIVSFLPPSSFFPASPFLRVKKSQLAMRFFSAILTAHVLIFNVRVLTGLH